MPLASVSAAVARARSASRPTYHENVLLAEQAGPRWVAAWARENVLLVGVPPLAPRHLAVG